MHIYHVIQVEYFVIRITFIIFILITFILFIIFIHITFMLSFQKNRSGNSDFCVRNIDYHKIGRKEIEIAEHGKCIQRQIAMLSWKDLTFFGRVIIMKMSIILPVTRKHFLVILKRTLQNYQKTLKECFLCTINRCKHSITHRCVNRYDGVTIVTQISKRDSFLPAAPTRMK